MLVASATGSGVGGRRAIGSRNVDRKALTISSIDGVVMAGLYNVNPMESKLEKHLNFSGSTSIYLSCVRGTLSTGNSTSTPALSLEKLLVRYI